MMVIVAGIRLFTNYAYPGWASTVVVGGAILTLQSVGFLVCFAFLSRIMNFLQRVSEKNESSLPYTLISESGVGAEAEALAKVKGLKAS